MELVMDLHSLGKKYGTDKAKHMYNGFSYLGIYDKYFSKHRYNVKNFVEIGVYKGYSLKMWKEYFPNAKIYGIDINPESKQYEQDRIEIIIADQNNDNDLSKIKNLIPSIDILIDDGSHITNHQIKTYKYLHNNISKNGFYVIEDLRNSYEENIENIDLRKVWPGMIYNNKNDDLRNKRSDFNDWLLQNIKSLDFHNQDTKEILGIHIYPMFIIIENI